MPELAWQSKETFEPCGRIWTYIDQRGVRSNRGATTLTKVRSCCNQLHIWALPGVKERYKEYKEGKREEMGGKKRGKEKEEKRNDD